MEESSGFRKFLLIPEDKHVITKNHLSQLDHLMLKILNSSLPDSEKLHRYYELLQKRMNLQHFNQPFKSNQEESVVMQESSSNDTVKQEEPIDKASLSQDSHYDSIIINSMPEKLKKKADNALTIFKTRPNLIQWTDKGEFIYKKEVIPNSNIADLLGIILVDRKTINIPGKAEFLKLLDELNMPKQYIKNKYLNVSPVIKASPVKKKFKPNVSPVIKKSFVKGKNVPKMWLSTKF